MSLAETHRACEKGPPSNSWRVVQERGQSGAKELSTYRLRLPSGASSATWQSAGNEAVFVVHSGAGEAHCGGSSWEFSRRSPFVDRAAAVYVPPGAQLIVRSAAGDDRGVDGVLVSAPVPALVSSSEVVSPAFVGPNDITPLDRGRGAYRREVHNLFVDDPFCRRLMVGETFNPPGTWSSFPPHKHDGRNGEPRLEEVYYYKVDPREGAGLQLQYTTSGAENGAGEAERTLHWVRDGDTVVIPYGYHPVSALPGCRLYYLWALVGDERRLALFEDPGFQFVHELPDP